MKYAAIILMALSLQVHAAQDLDPSTDDRRIVNAILDNQDVIPLNVCIGHEVAIHVPDGRIVNWTGSGITNKTGNKTAAWKAAMLKGRKVITFRPHPKTKMQRKSSAHLVIESKGGEKYVQTITLKPVGPKQNPHFKAVLSSPIKEATQDLYGEPVDYGNRNDCEWLPRDEYNMDYSHSVYNVVGIFDDGERTYFQPKDKTESSPVIEMWMGGEYVRAQGPSYRCGMIVVPTISKKWRVTFPNGPVDCINKDD